MKQENIELNLLANVSTTLIENSEPSEIIKTLEKIFNYFGVTSKKFDELKKINIYIYDENSKTLKDFSKSWISIEPTQNNYNDKLYLVINQLSLFDVFINDNPYKLADLSDFSNIKTNEGNNIILFPLKKGNQPFGILELTFANSIENLLNFDFFMMLSIASYQISLKIQNTLLAEQMQKNIDFHKAMKDIAKIIETQYELNYIIPIIGEMIDRFVSNHLIYVFLREDEESEFKLIWPNNCRDKNIISLFSQIKPDLNFKLINDGRIGIFPLVDNKTLGYIVAHSTTNKLSSKEIDYIEQLSKQSSITMQRANAYAEVLQHATLDALTGLNNRRQFETRLKQEVSSAQRQEKPLCAIMMDIDFFKRVNDTYGHNAGDCVLKKVSEIIRREIRESDIASRYGGEEFSILLPFTKIDEAIAVAERLRKAVEATVVEVPEEHKTLNIKLTISLGVYEYSSGDSPQGLNEKADKALYQAKENGRNQVCVFEN